MHRSFISRMALAALALCMIAAPGTAEITDDLVLYYSLDPVPVPYAGNTDYTMAWINEAPSESAVVPPGRGKPGSR